MLAFLQMFPPGSGRFLQRLVQCLVTGTLVLTTGQAFAATCTAQASGLWSNPAVWTCKTIPKSNDDVVIPSGFTVTLDVNSAKVNDLVIQAGGELRGDNTGKILLVGKAGGEDVTNNGTINFGEGNFAVIQLDKDSQWGGSGTWNLGQINNGGNRKLTFTAGSAFTINVSGNAVPITGTGSITSLAAIGWNFSGTVAQTLPSPTQVNATYGPITISNTSGVTLGAALTPANILGDLTVASNGVLNNGGLTVALAAGRNFAVQAGATFNLTGATTMVTVSGGGTKTFAATSTVRYVGTSAQAVTAETYGHLVLGGGAVKTIAAGTTNIAGNLTLDPATTYDGATNNPIVNLAGNFANGGTFNSGTGFFTFNGSAAQSLTGATTFTNLRIANTAPVASRKVAVSGDVTVSNQLTFSSGRIVTAGASKVVIPPGGAISGAGAGTGYVAGRLQKFVAAGSSTVTFEVGTDGASAPSLGYSPISAAFSGVTAGGGSVIGLATMGDHPQVAAGGLDGAKSTNRWWSLSTTGVSGTPLPAFTSLDPTFNFLAADVDVGANAGNFEIERWDGAAWNTTTAGTRTATSTSATGVTALGEFAVAEKKVVIVVGGFNAYDTVTPAGAVTGFIRTKIAGAPISVDITALDATKTAIQTTFAGTVKVELLNSSDNSGLPDANGCRSTWTVIQTLSPEPVFVVGDSGRKTISLTVPNSYVDTRLRITFPAAGTPIATGCSNDNFAIRPSAFTAFAVSDNDRTTAGTSRILGDTAFGTIVHNAGRPFSVRATAATAMAATATNYVGIPIAATTACAGLACTPTLGTLTLGTAFVAGQLITDAASYNEVGSFDLQLVDDTFAAVDNADGSTVAERRIQSPVISVGRFVPDNFGVMLNTPSFSTACGAGSFTYIGQRFPYATQPVITVVARDAANNTTTLYAGPWWRITNASLTGKAYTTAPAPATPVGTALDTSGAPGIDPVITVAGMGTGTLTFSSGAGFYFNRTTPVPPFDAEVSLAISVIDADGVTYAANPASFGAASPGNGIPFSAGKQMRFGQLRLASANGSNLLPLSLRIEAQHWQEPTPGKGYFVTNTGDSCTSLTTGNVGVGNFRGSLASGDTTPSIAVGALSSGLKSLVMSPPGGAKTGSVDVVLNLAPAAGVINTCVPYDPPAPTPTAADLAFLRGQWCGATADRDPVGRARFGSYRGGGDFIHYRENF